jgi:hypothetical protein
MLFAITIFVPSTIAAAAFGTNGLHPTENDCGENQEEQYDFFH